MRTEVDDGIVGAEEGQEGTGPGPESSMAPEREESQLVPIVSLNTIIGLVIKRLRKSRGIKQRALCDAAGISQSAYSRLENGRVVIPAEKAFILNTCLGCQMDIHVARLTGALTEAGYHVYQGQPSDLPTNYRLSGKEELEEIAMTTILQRPSSQASSPEPSSAPQPERLKSPALG